MPHQLFSVAMGMDIFSGRPFLDVVESFRGAGYSMAYAVREHPFDGKSFGFTRPAGVVDVFETAHFRASQRPTFFTLVYLVEISPNSAGPYRVIDFGSSQVADSYDVSTRAGQNDFNRAVQALCTSPIKGIVDEAKRIAEETLTLREFVLSATSAGCDSDVPPKLSFLLPKPWSIPVESESDIQRCKAAYHFAANAVGRTSEHKSLSRDFQLDAVETIAGRTFDPQLYFQTSMDL